MDIHDIELQILQLLALIIGSLIILALKRMLSYLHIQLDANRSAALEAAVNKAMTFGVTQADAEIRAKGWDHPDVKNSVLQFGLVQLGSAFGDTLSRAGIELDDPICRLQLESMMERMWPDIATRAAASPVTPAAPTPVAAAVVSAPPSTA